jgi:hypothetical protein
MELEYPLFLSEANAVFGPIPVFVMFIYSACAFFESLDWNFADFIGIAIREILLISTSMLFILPLSGCPKLL